MDEAIKKKVDEDWKETAKEETKKVDSTDEKQDFLPQEADFTFFISTLGMQASIALGDMPNPMTKKQETNLDQAKFFIDTIAMIKGKTSGNLSLEEDNFLDKLVYELKMRFVQKSNETKSEGEIKGEKGS